MMMKDDMHVTCGRASKRLGVQLVFRLFSAHLMRVLESVCSDTPCVLACPPLPPPRAPSTSHSLGFCFCDSSENGCEIQMPMTLTTAVVGLEVMEGFSDHGSYDGEGATSPIHDPASLA